MKILIITPLYNNSNDFPQKAENAGERKRANLDVCRALLGLRGRPTSCKVENCRSELLLATMCQAWVPRAPGSRGKTCGSRGSCSVWSAATLSQTMLSRFEHEVCVHSKKFAPALVSQRLFPDFLGVLLHPAGDGACWRTLLVPPVCLGTQGGQNILGCFRIQNTPTR